MSLRRTAGPITASVGASVRRTGDPTPIEVVFSPALPLGATGNGGATAATPGDLHATVSAKVMDTAELTVSYTGGWSIVPPTMPARIGRRSEAPRVLSERLDAAGSYIVTAEGLAGRSYTFRVRAPGGDRNETVTFPAAGANADGYTTLTLTIK